MSFSSITGIGEVPIQRNEYFSRDLLQKYVRHMAELKSVMDRGIQPGYRVVPADYNEIISIVEELAHLARNGQKDSENPDLKSFINTPMADRLEDIMRSLKVAGISADSSIRIPDREKIDRVEKWLSLSGFGLAQMLEDAIGLAITLTQTYIIDRKTQKPVAVPIPVGRTLQGMLELEYIKTSNDVISANLVGLEEALKLTQNILEQLQGLQVMSNLLTVNRPAKSFSAFAQDYHVYSATTPSSFRIRYRSAASAYFKQLFPFTHPPITAPRELWGTKLVLLKLIAQLELLNPSAGRLKPGTLAFNVYTVVKDISAAFSTFPFPIDKQALFNSSLVKFDSTFQHIPGVWILDAQDQAPTNPRFGQIQRNLTLALAAAENLNDAQKDTTRSYLYLFQQFYESASNMLERITRALEKIGKGADSK